MEMHCRAGNLLTAQGNWGGNEVIEDGHKVRVLCGLKDDRGEKVQRCKNAGGEALVGGRVPEKPPTQRGGERECSTDGKGSRRPPLNLDLSDKNTSFQE